MSGDQREQLTLERPELQRLFVNWLIHLLDERYGVKSRGSSGPARWSVTLADEGIIHVDVAHSGQIAVQGPPQYESDLAVLAEDAYTRTLALDFGEGAWWKASFSTDMGVTGATMLHFMRIMSEQNSRRFQGDWRLGDQALISFDQGNIEPAPMVVPKFDVHITFRVPAPGHGPQAEAIAEIKGTFLRAATSFATAAPLLGSSVLFAADAEEVEEATMKLPHAPELPVEQAGRSELPALPTEPAGRANLWPQILSLRPDPESSIEALQRVQGALYAYEQAIQQESEYVTMALLVSALEALSVPNASWQQDRVTTRFIRFVQELCPDVVNEIMQHGNFAQAFGPYSNPRRFLNLLYSLRSKPLHTGFVQHQLSVGPGPQVDTQIRVMLASGLVRAGITEFLRRPFSSLIGHPVIAPAGPDRSSVRSPRDP